MSVSLELFKAVDSPRSLAAWLLMKNKEFSQLVNLEINPDNYNDAESFANDYLATKFLSKFPDFSHENLKPEDAALESFFKYEETCRITNLKFKQLEEDPSKWDPAMRGILLRARRKIASVLREPDLDEIARLFDWGPGATTAASGHLTSAYVKFGNRLDVTSNSLVMGWCCVNSTPSWVGTQLKTDCFPNVNAMLLHSAFNIVRGNEIVFVPKNAKTHRIIAKEPHVNSYLQKGFGSYIRKRLRAAANVDLKDQTLNQRLAKAGSLTGSLATIDLSGASDTISQELVRFLLPSRWFSLLDQIRSKQGFLRKEKTWIYYHKFSSMGNACTFELESLIFWALCKSCLEVNGGEQTLNVYGDDIIVPTEHYESVVKVIQFVGFSVNEKKSFSSGRFRESCGKDYFDGFDVRPIFLKESISNVESLYKLANSIRRYSHDRNFRSGCDIRFLPVWKLVIDQCPQDLRFLIPEGNGDSGFISNFDEALPSLIHSKGGFRPKNGWEGFVYKGLTRIPVKLEMRDNGSAIAVMLSAIGKVPPLKNISLKDFILDPDILLSKTLPADGHHDLRKMTYPRVVRIHTHGWYDLGPWQ